MTQNIEYHKIRTIKLKNIPKNITITSIIDLIKDCELFSIKKISENIFHFTFFEYFIFYIAYMELKEKLKNLSKEINISFCESEDICSKKLQAYYSGASRSIYFHNLDKGFDEEYFKELAKPFGEVENIKISADKRHIQMRLYEFDSCVKLIQNLTEQDTTIKFGFHRAKSNNKALHTNRTLYLGNIQADVQPSDILKYCFFGPVNSLRFLRERKCAFLTFLNPNSAEIFIHNANKSPIFINKNRLKVTYGNNSMIPLSTILAIYNSNASRILEVNDSSSNCQFESLEKRIITENKTQYSFFTITAAIQAMDLLKQSYKESELRYVNDESSILTSTEYMWYINYMNI